MDFALSLGAVLGGFVFGFGIGLIVDQTPKILGVPKLSGSYFEVLIGVLNSLLQTSIPTFIVGVISIILLLLSRRYLPNISRTIVVVVIGILVSDPMGLEKYGVSIVGPIPTGLPSLVRPTLPPVSLTSFVFASLAIIFISLLKLAKELLRRNIQVALVNVDTEKLKLMRKTGTLE